MSPKRKIDSLNEQNDQKEQSPTEVKSRKRYHIKPLSQKEAITNLHNIFKYQARELPKHSNDRKKLKQLSKLCKGSNTPTQILDDLDTKLDLIRNLVIYQTCKKILGNFKKNEPPTPIPTTDSTSSIQSQLINPNTDCQISTLIPLSCTFISSPFTNSQPDQKQGDKFMPIDDEDGCTRTSSAAIINSSVASPTTIDPLQNNSQTFFQPNLKPEPLSQGNAQAEAFAKDVLASQPTSTNH
jgi:hypothetical protein